jgi:hypothetical protein
MALDGLSFVVFLPDSVCLTIAGWLPSEMKTVSKKNHKPQTANR